MLPAKEDKFDCMLFKFCKFYVFLNQLNAQNFFSLKICVEKNVTT